MNEQKLKEQADKDGIQRFTTGVVATNGNQILLVQRKADDFLGGLWELPGGAVDGGEQILVAALREFKEETGLDARRVIAYLGHFDYASKSGKKTRIFNYLAECDSGQPITLSEHQAFAWCEPEQLKEVTPQVVKIIAEAKKWLHKE